MAREISLGAGKITIDEAVGVVKLKIELASATSGYEITQIFDYDRSIAKEREYAFRGDLCLIDVWTSRPDDFEFWLILKPGTRVMIEVN